MKKLICVLCLLCSPPLFCQEIDKLLYQVEILAYQYPKQGMAQQEDWPKHPSVPDVSQAIQLSPHLTGNSKNTLELLPRSAMNLNKEQSVLARQKGVKILFHYAWLQNFEHGETIHIYANPERFPEQLYQLPPYSSQGLWTVDGTMRLNKGNYFNLSTQLLFKLGSPEQHLEFLIQQKRKLRENEVHYIDHPLIGLLVIITPAQALAGSN